MFITPDLIRQPPLAYLDPMVGSIIVQVVFGAIVGGYLIIKTHIQKIKSRIKDIFKK